MPINEWIDPKTPKSVNVSSRPDIESENVCSETNGCGVGSQKVGWRKVNIKRETEMIISLCKI
jgi:hypothetical protein